MIDLTSSLYLGLRHARDSLRPWAQLTTGVPAGLRQSDLSRLVAADLAGRIGTQAATMSPSTLHASWDLFAALDPQSSVIYVDIGAYPIARWGAERAQTRGAILRTTPHHDPVALRRRLDDDRRLGRRPIVLCDGMCPACGRVAPVPGYLAVIRPRDGILIVDDTQALGILGRPASDNPFGRGGGGVLRYTDVAGEESVVVVASLAKAYGAPVCVVAGSRRLTGRFERLGETRVHCSPPSAAHLMAASRALAIDRSSGDDLRRRLLGNVVRFRSGARRLRIDLVPGVFPFQTLVGDTRAASLHAQLDAAGIRTVLHESRSAVPAVSMLFTAAHSAAEVDHVVAVLGSIRQGKRSAIRRRTA